MRTTVAIERHVDRSYALKARAKRFKPGSSMIPVLTRDDVGLRVRMIEDRYHAGLRSSSGAAPENICTTYSVYLDGGHVADTFTASVQLTAQEIPMSDPVTAMRTNEVTDFGRLEVAARGLLTMVNEAGEDPSEAQLQRILNSYQNLLEFQRRAQERLLRAEGQIDVVATAMKGLFS